MRKLLTMVLLSASIFAFGQIRTQMHSKNNNWTYGGGLGLYLGSHSTFGLSVAPRVGYRVAPDFELGVAGGYAYQGNKYFRNNMFHVGPYANYYFGRSFFLSANFQEYFMNFRDKVIDDKFTHDEAALYLGAGYLMPLGGNAYMQIGASYNVLYKKDKSYFTNGFMPSVGFVVGL